MCCAQQWPRNWAGYRGECRVHTGSDLTVFLTWCTGRDLDLLNLGRAEIERYVRWLQELRRYQPSMVSRRLSVVVDFYRVCVIDGILAHSPADHPCQPNRPLSASGTCSSDHCRRPRDSSNRNDFA